MSIRRLNETKFLKRAFSKLKFFSEVELELPEENFLELFQVLKYEYKPKYSEIFKFGIIIPFLSINYTGDIGRKFYIIV